MFPKIPGNAIKDSGEYSRRFRGMLLKIPGNVPEDFGECYLRFSGIFEKIPGNVQEDSGEYFQFQINQSHVLLWSSFAISNEIIERSNKMISHFHFFWNSNWKEIVTIMWKSKKRKIKNQNKQNEKMNQRNESNICAFNLK